MDELVKEFLVESTENLDRLDQDFVALEKDSGARDRVASIFRTIHTIKGTCGFLGFSKLESVSHVGESLLSKLRDGELSPNSDIISGLLSMVDAIREILGNIENISSEGDRDYLALIETLTKLKEAGATASTQAAVPPTPPEADIAPVATTAQLPSAEADALPPVIAEPAYAPQAAVAIEHNDHETNDANPTSAAKEESKQSDSLSGVAGSGIRVDVVLLDRLMNLVGELVLARNQILQFSAATENATLTASSQRLNLITTELQEGVMKTRMQPIGNVWSKFPRIVRDVAQMCGKSVRVEMEGKETELDKTIIEAIKDPLTHIIRNSVDHGIETPAKRKAAGKSEEGLLSLRAFHEGGQVNIEIVDDGAGINIERVKAKAVERGLITADRAALMGDREATNLIFLPGFSTAEKLTNVSGRGVGMDVVKTNIERIGGTVDVHTKEGAGTSLRIKIPLTLAIIPALIITSGGDRFAIPQVSLLELVRLEEDHARTAVESIGGSPVYRLRGNILPLVYLNKQLKTGADAKNTDGAVNIVVLQADERQFGLVVDQINDTEEIVVKPLGKLFKGLATFAGATIMGDGCVALILDVMGLAQEANVVSESKDRGARGDDTHAKDSATPKQTLLLFRICGSRRMAIPLSLVARLEEFPASAVEFSGDQQVVQYRGQIMPLLPLSHMLADKRTIATDTALGASLQVIVHTADSRTVGLVVDRILDVVDEAITVQRTRATKGVLGSAVVEGKVTELLNVAEVARDLLSEIIDTTAANAA